MKDLLDNLDQGFEQPALDKDMVEELGHQIKDKAYLNFLIRTNGGYFYAGSLHFYGAAKEPSFHNIFYVNKVIHHEFGDMAKGMFFFAEEVLGNQYAYTSDGAIVLFNIETGEMEKLAKDFTHWLKVLKDDLEFLSGRGFIQEWNTLNDQLEYSQRLHPKFPFVAGGEYHISNFYKQYFPTYISSNANIARQVYNLPEGTPIKLRIDD